MARPMQVTVVNQAGVDVQRLHAAITYFFIESDVTIGQGPKVDGYPVGSLVIVDRT